jgi:acetyl esterase/lipase
MGIKKSMCLLLAAAWMLAAMPAHIPAQDTKHPVPLDPGIGITTIRLWETMPAAAASPMSDDVPTLTVFLPRQGKANGTSVVVAPGGAYRGLASDLEGREVADWFTARGVTAFVLKYRLGAKNIYPIPLLDAQRAIRLVRSFDTQYGLAADRVGIIGFSAGGHLAAMTGTMFDDGTSQAADPIDRLSDRPDFMVLGYPWLNAMQPNNDKKITYCSVTPSIPAETCKSFEQLYTPSLHVSSRTPPTFIFSTSDDATVPISASVDFYNSLHAAGISAELHIFHHGAHGSGLGSGDAALDMWPVLLEQWLRDGGLLKTKTITK